VPMRLREREECLLAGAIRTSNSVEIDLNFPIGTAVRNSLGQALCPFPNQLSSEENLGSIAEKENRRS